jgi:hypothetical protein
MRGLREEGQAPSEFTANYCQYNTHFDAFLCIFMREPEIWQDARRACVYEPYRVMGRSGFEPLKA